MLNHDTSSHSSANSRHDHKTDSKHRSSTPSDSGSSTHSDFRGSTRSDRQGTRSGSIHETSFIQSPKKTQAAKPPAVIHQANPAGQPQVGPQGSCTPTTATWQGSAHGGPSGDYIDWTIDSACNMTVTGGTLSQNYDSTKLPWQENGYKTKVTSLTIDGLVLQPGFTSLYTWCSQMRALTSFSAPNLDVSRIVSMNSMFDYCPALSNVDMSGWHTDSLIDLFAAFRECHSLKSLNLSGWNTSHVTNMSAIFYMSGITNLSLGGWNITSVTNAQYFSSGGTTTLKMDHWTTNQTTISLIPAMIKTSAAVNVDLSYLDTGDATSMANLFTDSSVGTTVTHYNLTGWNLPHVTDLSGLFSFNSKVTDIKMDHWTMDGNPITMDGMFYYCINLSNLTTVGLGTSNVTDMSQMFAGDAALTTLNVSGWDTSKVTTMNETFYADIALTTLDVSNWDTGNVTTMFAMFNEDATLTTLDVSGWDTSSLANASSMFDRMSSLTSLDLSSWTTPQLTNTSKMFRNASSLATLDLSGWNTNGVTDTTDMFSNTSLQRIRLGANTGKLDQQIRQSVFPASPVKTISVEGALQPTTFPDGSTTYALPQFQSDSIPADAFTTAVTQPTWFGVAKIGIQYTHGDGTVGDYPHPCLDWTGAGTCTVARSTGLTGSANRRLSWIDTGNTAHIPGDTLTQDGFLTVTPQWNPMPIPNVDSVTWPHDMGGGSKSIRATGTASDLRGDDTIPVRFTWTDSTGTEQHMDAEADIDGSNWTADLTDAPSLASMEAADQIGTGTKVTVTARVKDAGGPLGYWSTGKDGNVDMVAPAVADAYAAPAGAGGVAMSSDRSQAVAEPGDTLTISWLDNTNTPISWPDGGGTTTTLTVTAGPGGHFTATKPIAVTGAKKVQYVLSDGLNTSEPFTKKITDPITAIPLTGGPAELWSKLLLILLAVTLIGLTTLLRNRRNHGLRLVTPHRPHQAGAPRLHHHQPPRRQTHWSRSTPHQVDNSPPRHNSPPQHSNPPHLTDRKHPPTTKNYR
ncbi:BspA family leucine-rich repeat surface protein [Bifidobacterium sp. ESL0790]|uniref:BspA family leucine-rich repeat surface protein n=1 Tax=Bifidobacterium sp. ESL0790 TaxID=2983233 RepID=UPI0023F6327E|nr:BspA family leucine-rich repeat surface protein [Bifidobacterium sp. ESL0790]WEV71844.1 BspA family leucine-rich repeat surface protein [Bifidobacterium sp. ESL0790]